MALNSFLVKVLILISFYLPGFLYAHVYRADVDEAQWNIEISPLYCRLWQRVPAYGRGLFEHEAGERQVFMLESQKKVLHAGQASVAVTAPEWKHDQPSINLGVVSLGMGHTPIRLEEPNTSTLLDHLEAGYFPEFRHPGWGSVHRVDVQLSSVNFTAAYEEYLNCLGGLYPANFRQLERSTILFDVDQYEIRPEYNERLKLLVGYLEVDPTVKQIVLDGHTDSMGTYGHNWELSRNRAMAVEERLKSLGVPESKLMVRFHGERYPVAINNSDEKRQKNRRTTLRLDRGD